MKKFFSILLIVIAIGLFVGFANPWYREARTLQAEVSSYSAALDNARDLRVVRDDLLARYTSFSQQDIAHLSELLPDSVGNIKLILQIDTLASQNNLSSLTNVRFEAEDMNSEESSRPVVASAPYDTFELQFETAGSYSDFVRFLQDLETNLRLTRVKSVSFISNQEEMRGGGNSVSVGAGIYTYEVTVVTYWLPR